MRAPGSSFLEVPLDRDSISLVAQCLSLLFGSSDSTRDPLHNYISFQLGNCRDDCEESLPQGGTEHGGKEMSEIEVGCKESSGHPILSVRDDGIGLKTMIVKRSLSPMSEEECPVESKARASDSLS